MSVMMTSSNGNIFRVTGPLYGWVSNREAGDLRCHRGHYGGWEPWLYFRVCIFGFCMSFPFTEDGAVALSPSMAMTVSVLCRRLSSNSLRPNDAYMRRKNDQDYFRQWPGAWTAPSHFLNQYRNTVNWTLRNKLQWNFNRNSNTFLEHNTFENADC